MKLKTEELIQSLVTDLKPVKKKYGWKLPLLLWVALFIIVISLNYYFTTLFFYQEEKEIKHTLIHPIFFLGVITSFSAFFTALFASLPGRNYRIWKIITNLSFISWSLVIFFESYKENFQFEFIETLQCNIGTIIFASVYFIIIYSLLKRRYILDFQTALLGGILTSSITGTLCVGIMCFEEGASHIFFGHYLPTLILFGIAYMILKIKHT